jgi:hypothetical protein
MMTLLNVDDNGDTATECISPEDLVLDKEWQTNNMLKINKATDKKLVEYITAKPRTFTCVQNRNTFHKAKSVQIQDHVSKREQVIVTIKMLSKEEGDTVTFSRLTVAIIKR